MRRLDFQGLRQAVVRFSSSSVASASPTLHTRRRQKGQPAGGRFRGGVGRFFFRTTNLFQNIVSPDLCVNKIDFRLFNIIPGYVALTGRFESENGSRQAVTARSDGRSEQAHHACQRGSSTGFVWSSQLSLRAPCQVRFEQPQLQLGALRFAIGPKSAVGLSTTYLDDRIRLVRE